jgi:hypothetical protein
VRGLSNYLPLESVRHVWRLLPHSVRRSIWHGRLILREQLRLLLGLSLRRTRPYSEHYGNDRGLPIDRIYIEDFLARHADDVRGEVLEVQSPAYTQGFGADRVSGSSVVDLDPSNPRATVIADLCEPGALPDRRFDCIILTQTLQYLGRPDIALRNLWSALTPDGVLLLTVPALSRLDPAAGASDRWRFTPFGLETLLRAALPPEAEIEVAGYGNAIAGAAFFVGLATQDIGRKRIRSLDTAFPVSCCARVRRAC